MPTVTAPPKIHQLLSGSVHSDNAPAAAVRMIRAERVTSLQPGAAHHGIRTLRATLYDMDESRGLDLFSECNPRSPPLSAPTARRPSTPCGNPPQPRNERGSTCLPGRIEPGSATARSWPRKATENTGFRANRRMCQIRPSPAEWATHGCYRPLGVCTSKPWPLSSRTRGRRPQSSKSRRSISSGRSTSGPNARGTPSPGHSPNA